VLDRRREFASFFLRSLRSFAAIADLSDDEPTPTRRGVTFRVAAVADIDASKLGNIGVWIDVTPGGPTAYSRPRP
jgi:hypothetical protein